MDARSTRASRPSTWSARNPIQILHDRHRQVLHDRYRYHRHNLHQRQDYDTATARRPSPWPEALRCDSGQCDRLVVRGASPPNIGLFTEPKRLQWWCSQLSSNVFHFREHNQRSNQTYSLPWPQAVNIRCAQYLAEVVREPGQRPCSIWHRRRLQLVPSPSFVPLHRLRNQSPPSSVRSVPTSPSQKEQEEEEEKDAEEDFEVWLS